MNFSDNLISFLLWVEQPQQIILCSLFFILICFIVTKISKRQKIKHAEFRVRDPRKGHHWVHSDFLIHPVYCNSCELPVVRGVFCDTCWLCVHDECESNGNTKFACKVMSLSSERASMHHHWMKGNFPLCSNCTVCSLPCGVEPRLCDFRCLWCHETVHEGQCYGKVNVQCSFGIYQQMVLPPYCVSLKMVGWRGRKQFAIKSVKTPSNIKDWKPVLVLANPKSGSNEGLKLLRTFRKLFNPAQVIDLNEVPPEIALEFCCLLPDVQTRILICGGDGTVGWVLNAIDKTDIKILPQIGIHPLGTGNDLARVLGWGLKYVGDEHEVDDLLNDFQQAKVVPFDRWKVTVENTGFFKKKLPPKVLHMNSYVSVGCDAQVVLNFHKHRETTPSLFTSRIINKLMYFIYGSRDVIEAQCKNLHERLQLELDGQQIALPQLEGIVVLNINSWCGGCKIWNVSETDDQHKASLFNDGYLEVIGLYSALHIAKLQVNLADPIKLGRAKNITIRLNKTKQQKNCPMQVDGEPWEQSGPCVVTVTHLNQAMMLQTDADT